MAKLNINQIEKMASVASSGNPMLTGAATGAVLGSMIPIVGTTIGAGVGAALGGLMALGKKKEG
ncbi:hypothetical protein NHP190012_03630 [Helicobacter sp. NHP19-012]|uniref:Glycine zipper domain-containing protein n=1 Tax=Helicobacter gastrofelis TaxID=2849642 RepID=A0ABN6I540_9HELI|nr:MULTISPECIES: glycine zipper domain-containing protein [unclassified Helicobacter]BCZ18721.1 hypothetical protein NHP190012_03630 [Helicobacter sp. NHP19-012]GMB96137.1 hypothetical protein NHP22001_07260 [Helicobacter sp. NHP22-001]